MDLTAQITHLFNFAAPAVALALLLPLGGRFIIGNAAPRLVWWAQVAILFVVCLAVLVGGLSYFGRDGKMATYAAMVLAGASAQWLLGRGWRA